MLLELKQVVKDVGDRRLFRIDDLKVYPGERIGLVGANGVGKTTLLQIMAGKTEPDSGTVWRQGSLSVISQLDDAEPAAISNPSLASQFQVDRPYSETMSGGEKTRYKIAAALSQESALLLADEPTANLDIQGIELLQQKLKEYTGALVLVSHDRLLLEAVCEKIWEIDQREVKVFKGSFQDYLVEKENERKRREAEYESYLAEKKKLEEAIADRARRAASLRKTPKRMGGSEARLHKMGCQKAKTNLEKAVKAMRSRLGKLEKKEKPPKETAVVFDLRPAKTLPGKVALQGEGVSKSFGSRTLFDGIQFRIFNGQKVALVGPNGCGKTTLLKMIVTGEAGINIAPQVRFGYFGQEMAELDLSQSVLSNVMATSIHDQGFVRILLARLLFKREDVFKPVAVMSGGERIRIALARIIVSDANVLLLDEPTNYLDLLSIQALESVLAEYQGTILFASHDRQFINSIATHLMLFEAGKVRLFPGNYQKYLEHEQGKREKQPAADRFLLEHRLSEVLSKLSLAKDKDDRDQLEQEYQDLLRRLRGD